MSPSYTNGTAAHEDEEDIDYTDIEERYNVQDQEGFDNIVIVDGVPVIDKSREEKLISRIAKEFTRKGAAIKPENIHVPWDDEAGKNKGFLFMEFPSIDAATFAINAMHGHPFDSKHTFTLNKFSDVERFAKMDETYREPEIEEHKPKEHLRAWLADPLGRDQYVTYRNELISVHWHAKPASAEIAHEMKGLEAIYVAWSPHGTLLTTLHRQGVRLWGGPSWKPQQRFAHPQVKLIDFSPCEQYLITWSNEPVTIPPNATQGPTFFSPEDEGNSIAVWEIKTGHLLRTFPVVQSTTEEGGKKQMNWPALKWSYDDKYAARVTPGQQISVYELPSMSLLDKKSIKIDGVVDFEWCPIGEKDREEAAKPGGTKAAKIRETMLVYWTPEVANQPARVTLISLPSRTVLRSKNLFNVSDCKLHWQNQGDYLCVKVDRHTKTKKSFFCNLEIFRVREKDYPVEVLELKDTVTEFAWEPKGERFAIICTSDPNLGNPGPGVALKTDVNLYQLDRTKGDFELLKAMTGRTTNTIRWSPKGRHVVFATVGSSSKSDLEFWDLDFTLDDTSRKEVSSLSKDEWGSNIQLLASCDHYGMTDVEWDPSGRYLATSASVWRHAIENGFTIWDFRGQEHTRHLVDRFKQFLWRPRPRTLLTKEQQKQIRKNLRDFSRVFDEEDAAEESNVSAELVALRKRLVSEWNAWRAKVRKDLEDEKAITSTGGEQESEEITEWIDEVTETIEEIAD